MVRAYHHLTGTQRCQIETLLACQCDLGFVFGTIQKSPYKRPNTYLLYDFDSKGRRKVNIRITAHSCESHSPDQGPWQVAHECVHLLDSGYKGSANILEEGLATWFQYEPKYHVECVRSYISKQEEISDNYWEARELVRHSLPEILNAVKTLRATGIRIRDITADDLMSLPQSIDKEVAERLCDSFS